MPSKSTVISLLRGLYFPVFKKEKKAEVKLAHLVKVAKPWSQELHVIADYLNRLFFLMMTAKMKTHFK